MTVEDAIAILNQFPKDMGIYMYETNEDGAHEPVELIAICRKEAEKITPVFIAVRKSKQDDPKVH